MLKGKLTVTVLVVFELLSLHSFAVLSRLINGQVPDLIL